VVIDKRGLQEPDPTGQYQHILLTVPHRDWPARLSTRSASRCPDPKRRPERRSHRVESVMCS
jgi:hypothetical protein